MTLDTVPLHTRFSFRTIDDEALQLQLLRHGLVPQATTCTVSARSLFGPVVLDLGHSELALGRELARALQVELQ